MGINTGEASYLLSVIGISNIIGKLGLGYLSDHPRINRKYLYATNVMICGISEYYFVNFHVCVFIDSSMRTGILMNNFCFNYLTNIVYCIVFGVTSGAYIGMTAVILRDVIGPKAFIQGYGFQSFFMGTGVAMGPPIIGNCHTKYNNNKYCSFDSLSGAFYEGTGNHDIGFYFAGAMVFISGVLVLLLTRLKHQKEEREEKMQDTYAESTNKMLHSTLKLQSIIVLQLGLPSESQTKRADSIADSSLVPAPMVEPAPLLKSAHNVELAP